MGRKCKLKEAAEILGLSEHALRRMVKGGEVPFITAGNRFIFDIEQVEDALREAALRNMLKNSDMKSRCIRRVDL